ncbi:MAG: radical SAM protein [Nanoarchaeota archaeon]|nr:radical SAM protein [Nanoarchaeota archaeon]
MKEIIDSSSLSPINVTWELTLACNLRCKHCGSSAGKCRQNELSLDKSLKLCEELEELGTKEVTLIGGEPLISDRWFHITKKLNELKIKVNIVSNGTIMDDKLLRNLKEVKINNLGISIDGKKETNDSIRGAGVFDKIINTIKKLQDNGIKISIATTISRFNFPELNEIYGELIELGIKVWQIQLAMPVGRMTSDFMIDKKDLRKLVEFIIKINKEGKLRIFPGCNVGYFGDLEEEYRIQKEESALPFWTGCYSGIFEMGIMSNGSIKGCLAMKDKFIEGNLNEKSLKEIWNNKDAFSYNREFKRSCLKEFCSRCEYGDICRGGCPIISEALTGSTNNDPYCIERIEKEMIS